MRICGSLSIETSLGRSFDYIRGYLPVTEMHLLLFDPGLDLVRTFASVSSEEGEDFGRILPMPEETRDARMASWISMKEIEIVNQPDLRPEVGGILRKHGRRTDISMMAVRLELEGNRVGLLLMITNGTDKYTEEHGRLMRLLHDPFAVAMANALQHEELGRLKDMLADDNRYLRRELLELSGSEIVGADFGLKGVMETVKQVASLDSPVLLLGETGVGKDVIANAIHYSSRRKEGPLIKVNCGAIPDNLLDSELFGHEKGAFTGAIAQKRGRFERAHKGTIFLDEIGELPPHAQVRLLHVIQSKEIERVGGTSSITVDIRIISATNRNLLEMVTSHQFREDLWFRLNVFPIMIPPLRQRKGDIPALVHYFLEQKTRELKLEKNPVLSPRAIDPLMAYDWPGNVRELENLVERALVQYRGGMLSFENLVSTKHPNAELPLPSSQNRELLKLDEAVSLLIRRALQLAKGKVSGPGGAASLLGVNPSTLRKKMKKLAIPYGMKKG
jgi:transcriptional regulator with GAF, ATPase, and Fis domain